MEISALRWDSPKEEVRSIPIVRCTPLPDDCAAHDNPSHVPTCGHLPSGRVRCWAFEPPGGLMTRAVSRALQPICTTTALAKDIVPRLGVATFEHLREDMVRADAFAFWLMHLWF